MKLAKLCAIAFCGGVLAFQSYAVLSPLRQRYAYLNRYWPFLNYPMYSDAHRLGESLSGTAVRVVPCGPDATPVPVTSEQLRVKWVPFKRMIAQAADLPPYRGRTSPAAAERATRQLRHYAATRLSIPVCAVQIWSRTYTIGRQGFEHADTSWRVAAQWALTQTDSMAPDVSDSSLP